MTVRTAPAEPFDLTAPLARRGRLAIGASAGTGKTFTLAALACRYVAEHDVAIGELLVVTFTRAAAAELRERIRARLSGAAAALEQHSAGRPHPDPVVAHLLAAAPGDVERRRQRLERAVVDFDTATITTIHGFCAQVLAAQGSTGPFDPSAVLVQDPDELVGAAVADVLVEAALADAAQAGEAPTELPKPSRLRKLVQTVLANPGIDVVAGSGVAADNRTRDLVERVVERVHEQLVRTGGVTFDEQLSRVAELLEGDPALRRSLAEQFSVVMIDESQDTDPIQWAALTTAFDGSESVLVVVGDPKQAIYSFRGGDVVNYLKSVNSADRRSLGTNFRSDGAAVEAMNQMWDGVTLGHPDIPYELVTSPPELQRRSLHLDGRPVPGLWIRSVTHAEQPRKKADVKAPEARSTIREDLANHIALLLSSGEVVQATGRPDGGSSALSAPSASVASVADPRPLRPDDVAVLVKARSDGPPIQRALLERGVASVIIGAGSVTESLAASHWRWLIEALKRPADPRLARAVALSWFFDLPVAVVAESASPSGLGAATGADALAGVQATLAGWVEVLRRQGVAALVERVWRDGGVTERVLVRATGERDLTDLEHLGELLHAGTGGRPVGPEALAECFEALDDPDDEAVEDPDAIRRRVDSDTAAVRIMTIHVSKGLEFPVVCCPTLWSTKAVRSEERMYHDTDGRRLLDVSDKPTPEVAATVRDEVDGELLRLTYVALTRALHTTLVWWAPTKGSDRSGLARLLFGDGEQPGRAAVPSDNVDTVDVVAERVASIGAADVVRVEAVPVDPGTIAADLGADPTHGAATVVELHVARLGRELDRSAGRWSFTSVAARAAHPEPAPDRPAGGGDAQDADDPVLGDSGDDDEKALPPPVLFDGLGAGAAFGTLVHSALEAVDFATDLEGQLTEVLDVPWSSVTGDDVPRLVQAIAAAVRTPLGAAFADRPLSMLSRADRLDELDFELPLGDRSGAGRPTVHAGSIGAVLLRHLAADDVLTPWVERLAGGLIDVEVGGHLTGSIDLVMRVPSPGGGHRYSVVDYKTNRLGPWGTPDSVANYHPDRLPAAMELHDYPLQAVLYTVALHRYLRWRVADYSPDRHLGPVGYLFVRGMVGPATPAPDGRTHGVFTWTVPPAAVVELSDLLHGHGEPGSGGVPGGAP